MVLSTRKKITSVVALGLTTALLFGSTFAWQSLNQEALNYVKGGANPGGRLHDDFNNITTEIDPHTEMAYAVKTYDKDVYVENFTSAADDGVKIYARVRLDEYLEWGTGAGVLNSDGSASDQNHATSLVDGAELSKKSTWTTFKPGSDSDDPFREYWTLTWEEGGSTVYMPTFNKNKDSLAADINGTSGASFDDYVDYSEDRYASEGRTAYAIYDKDDDTADELTAGKVNVDKVIETGVIPDGYEDDIRVAQEKHMAATTLLAAGSMSMEQWLAATENGTELDGVDPCWVYDVDGWFYWSAAIAPGTATGKLLDQIQRTETTIGNGEEEWYYGLNVVAQFITKDDLGTPGSEGQPGTGFYDRDKGAPPTENAETLLHAIGVTVGGEDAPNAVALDSQAVEAGDEHQLRQALEQGQDVILTDDIQLEAAVVAEQDAFIYLNGCSISAGEDFQGSALFIVSDGAWVDFDNNGTLRAPEDGHGVLVKDGGLLYVWDGTFVGGKSAVYVEDGEAVIVDGTFRLQEDGGTLLDWEEEGKITVYGGTFYDFDPSDVGGSSLLPEGYVVSAAEQGGSTLYTASLKVSADGEEDPAPTEDESNEPAPEETPDGEDQGAAAAPDSAGAEDESADAGENGGAGTLSGISGKAETAPPHEDDESEHTDSTAAETEPSAADGAQEGADAE